MKMIIRITTLVLGCMLGNAAFAQDPVNVRFSWKMKGDYPLIPGAYVGIEAHTVRM